MRGRNVTNLMDLKLEDASMVEVEELGYHPIHAHSAPVVADGTIVELGAVRNRPTVEGEVAGNQSVVEGGATGNGPAVEGRLAGSLIGATCCQRGWERCRICSQAMPGLLSGLVLLLLDYVLTLSSFAAATLPSSAPVPLLHRASCMLLLPTAPSAAWLTPTASTRFDL